MNNANIFNGETTMQHAGELAAIGESTQQRVIELFRLNAKRKRITKQQVEDFRAGMIAELDDIQPARIGEDGQPESDKKRKAWLSGRANQYLNRTRSKLAKEEIVVWKSAKGGKNSGNTKAAESKAAESKAAESKAAESSETADERAPRHELAPTPQVALDCLASRIACARGKAAARREAYAQLEKVAAFLGLDIATD